MNINNSNIYRIITESGASLILKVLGQLFQLITIYLVTQMTSESTLGEFLFCLVLVGLLSLISSMGLHTYSIKQFSSKDSSKYDDLVFFKSAYKLIILVSLSISILLISFSDNLSILFFDNIEKSRVFTFCGFMVVPSVYLLFSSSILRGLFFIKTYSFLFFVSSWMLMTIIIFLFGPSGEYFIGYYYLISLLITALLVSIVLFHNRDKFFKSQNKDISISKLLKKSLPMMLTASLFMLVDKLDLLMISVIKGDYDTGIYGVVTRISMLIALPLIALNTVAAPMISKTYSSGEENQFRDMIIDMARLSAIYAFFALLIVISFGNLLLGIFGESFSSQGYIALLILTFGKFIHSLAGPIGLVFQMTGFQYQHQNIILISLLINILLNYFFISYFGIVGAAAATSLSLIIVFLFQFFFFRYKFNFYPIFKK